MADGYSRVRLDCHALSSTRVAEARPLCTGLFTACGWPKRLRTDNGVPLATNPLGRLSQRSAWWVSLGLLPACLEPGTPHQNGRPARRHGTLQAATTRSPARTRRAQQRKCERFREECTCQRPHAALAMRTPAACDAPSARKMPTTLPLLGYPGRFEVRYVSANGGIRWHHRWGNVSHIGVGEYGGREAMDDGVWNVYCGPLKLGRFLERHRRIEDAYGRLKRRR